MAISPKGLGLSPTYIVAFLVIAAIFSWAGVAFFGVTIVAGTIFAALLGLFIPVLILLIAFMVLVGFIPTPGWHVRMIVGIGLVVLAWIIQSLPGGGM